MVPRSHASFQPAGSTFERWLRGQSEPRRPDLVDILWAVREECGDHGLRVEQLFDLDPMSRSNRLRIETESVRPETG